MINQEFSKYILPFVQAEAEGRDIEVKGENYPEWEPKTCLSWYGNLEYRIKHKTETVNGFEIPAPVKHLVPGCSEFYVANIYDNQMFIEQSIYQLKHHSSLDLILDRGIVYTEKEHAIMKSKALLGIDPFDEGKE